MTTPLRHLASIVEPFDDLARVTLTRALSAEKGELPIGTRGTVVGCYGDGVGYEVELEDSFHAVVTVKASYLHNLQ